MNQLTPQGIPGQVAAGPHDSSAAANGLHSVMRFLRTVRYRKGIMIFCMFLCGALGLLYYVTATRLYQSGAELYVQRVGAGVMDDDGGSNPTGDMPTFQKIMKSEEIVGRSLRELPPKYRVDLRRVPRDNWVSTLQNNLSVRSARQTNVLELSYRSRDPEAAAAVLRSMLQAFQDFMNETHQSTSEGNLMVLQTKYEENRNALQTKFNELQTLKNRTQNFIDGGTEQASFSVAAENVRNLTREFDVARQETMQAQLMVEAITGAIQNGEDVMQHALQAVDAVGNQMIEGLFGLGAHDSLHMARLNQDLIELQAELRDALNVYGENHSKVKRLQAELQLKNQYALELPQVQRKKMQQLAATEIAPTLQQMSQQRLRSATARERAVWQQLEVAKQEATRLNLEISHARELEKEIDQLRSENLALIERITSIDLEKETGITMQVTTHPTPVTKPVSPRLSIVALLSLMMGSCMGLGSIYVMDVMDDRFRSPEELRLQLGAPVLAMIPKMELLDEADGFLNVHTYAQPNGSESEAFRTLRTAIDFSQSETGRLVSTSTEPGDGKTTVTANLAVAFAQSGKRTLLIDADMRRPGLTNMLQLRDAYGLSQVLRSDDAVSTDAINHILISEVEGLHVLPCGTRPVNPSELLAGDRFAELLAWAETVYDQILIDAPPILAVSDPAIVGRLVDGVVVVVRPDKDRRRMVIRAAETLRSLGCQMLGIVVNHLSLEDGSDYSYSYGYGYGYSYGYGHDSTRTGEDDDGFADDGYADDGHDYDYLDHKVAADSPHDGYDDVYPDEGYADDRYVDVAADRSSSPQRPSVRIAQDTAPHDGVQVELGGYGELPADVDGYEDDADWPRRDVA